MPEHPEQCSRQARYGYILPPVLSGRVSTRRSFSFRYGVLEMRAKLPSGDWIYPGRVKLKLLLSRSWPIVEEEVGAK